MRTIKVKLFDTVRFVQDGEVTDFDHMDELFDAFGWGDEQEEAKSALTRALFCFRHVDLTDACNGHDTHVYWVGGGEA